MGLQGLVTNTQLDVVGDGREGERGVALQAGRRRARCALSAAAGSPNAGVMIALRVVGGVAAASSQKPSAAPLSSSTCSGATSWRGAIARAGRGLVRVRRRSCFQAVRTASVSHCGGGPSTTLTAKSSSPGRTSLSPWSARFTGSSSARPATTSTTRSATAASACVASPVRSSQRRVGASTGTGPRPASSATTISGRVAGRRERVDAGAHDASTSGASSERAVAVHHAGDPGAEAVEQDRAGRARASPRVVVDLDRRPPRAAAGLVGGDPRGHLGVGRRAGGDVRAAVERAASASALLPLRRPPRTSVRLMLRSRGAR